MNNRGAKRCARILLLSSAFLVPMIGVSAPACAAVQDQAAAKIRLNIPSQDLGSALSEFARQSNQQLLYSPDLVKGKSSTGVSGIFTPRQGLERLLAGTGIRISTASSGAFLLNEGAPQGNAGAAEAAVSLGGDTGADVANATIVVTGTSLKKTVGLPTNTYTSEDIQRSGQPTLERFLSTRPEFSVAMAGNGSDTYAGQSTVRLRGLPAGTTAVLLDGRRLGESALSVLSIFDISLIPAALIERIDIVPVGSSAIYGSDAIGGVVNIVLKKRLRGFDAGASYSFSRDLTAKQADLSFGTGNDHGRLVAGASFYEQDGLYSQDRALTANKDYGRFGGLDWRNTSWCTPGTVFAVSGTLNGVGTSSAPIPPTGADNLANYRPGTQVCSGRDVLVPPSKRAAGFISGEYNLADDLTVYAQLFYSRAKTDTTFTGLRLFNHAVSASNSHNPFGQPVTITELLPLPTGTKLSSTVYRPLVGVRGGLAKGWDFDLAAWETVTIDKPIDYASSPILDAAIDASGINLFAPSSNSASLLEEVNIPVFGRSKDETAVLSSVVRGSPFRLPGGDAQLAIGAEGRRDRFRMGTTSGGHTNGNRSAWSVFAETEVPIIGPAGKFTVPRLTINGAIRYDHYSDFGGRWSPQFRGAASFLPGVLLTASYSTSFKAPGLGWLNLAQRPPGPPINAFFDPVRQEFPVLRTRGGGNPNLQPETGKAQTLALTINPPAAQSLGLNATFYKIEEKNRISIPSAQTILNNQDLFADRITRDPVTGSVTLLNLTYINFGALKTSGLDFSAEYGIPLVGGELRPSVALNRTLTYKAQLIPRAPFQQRLGHATSGDAWAPRWKATTSLGWTGRTADMQATARYVGKYLDYQTPANTSKLGGEWYFDATVGLNLDQLGLPLPATTLRLSTVNLFNNLPSYSRFNFISGFDPAEADIVGRRITIGLRTRF